MRRTQRGPWRAPNRRPVRGISAVIGVVWEVPSHQAARDALREIRQAQHELKPGPLVEDATLFSSCDDDGYCVVVVAIGKMFDATFLARCGICVQKQGGQLLPDSKRKQDLIKWARVEWVKMLKQEKQKTQTLRNNARRNLV